MDTHRIKVLLILGITAIVIVGCQRDEPAVTEESQAELPAAEIRTAWVDAERLLNADSDPQNWLAHGRTSSEQRHSPLDQINDSNVDELGLAWFADLDTSRGQQASPIIVDGMMYTTSAWSKVQAIDAATGECCRSRIKTRLVQRGGIIRRQDHWVSFD